MAKKEEEQKNSGVNLAEIRKQLDKQRAKYELEKENFANLRDKLEEEFKANLNSLLSDEERDILDLEDDPVKKYEVLEQKRKEFIDDKLEAAKKELEAMEKLIDENEDKYRALEIEQKFRQEHPDIDADGFAVWLKDEISPRLKREMLEEAGGDQLKFLGLAAQKFLELNSKEEAQEAQLPQDLHDIAGESGNVDKNLDDSEEIDVSKMFRRV